MSTSVMRFFSLDTLGDLNDMDLAMVDGPPDGMKMRGYTLARGKPAAPHFPKQPRISLREDRSGIRLTTLLGNTHGHLVVHSDMKEVIAAHCDGLAVEYLPVDLYDHRNRLYSRDYLFINPLGSWDCLDPVASGFVEGSEGGVIHVEECVLAPEKVGPLPSFFRVQEEPSVYVVSQALADALREKNFTNVVLEPLAVASRS